MDALVELLPLLFIGLYYLLAARRRAAKQQASREVAPQTELVSDEHQAPTPFQAFLQQLEAAAAEASGTPLEAPDEELQPERRIPPSPVPPARLEPAPAPPEEFKAPVGSFDSRWPSDHAAHGFGRENPLSEEAFENAPAFVEPRGARDRSYDPHGLAPRAPRELGRDWRRALRDPKAAREAFVLQTIFGPRGGRRSENR